MPTVDDGRLADLLSGDKSDTPQITSDSDKHHAFVLGRALSIYQERNAKRSDAWRDAGWKGQLVEARKKLDRLWAIWRLDREPDAKDIDEAIDLINAIVFWVRCVEEDNEDGKWPWP